MSLRRSQVLALTSCNICHCKSRKADQRKYYAEVITVIHKKMEGCGSQGTKPIVFHCPSA